MEEQAPEERDLSVSDPLADTKKISKPQKFKETWSILRFVKGGKEKGIEISPSGLTVKITKSQGSKHKNEEELLLTNMAFYYGLHLWEIIATIKVGVYNPVTKKEVLTSFKTTTPRVITVLLDLNENVLKFWLNDRRNQNKTIKLGQEKEIFTGPWIPCVMIGKEKNKIILNPYAKEPSDFYEKDFDKVFNQNKYLLPFLTNMICIANLPKVNNLKDASNQLKDIFQIQNNEINQIIMNQNKSQNGSENTTFYFVQFHSIEQLSQFLHKNKEKEAQFRIFDTNDIIQWFQIPEDKLSPEVLYPFKEISQYVSIPSSKNDQEVLETINKAYLKLTSMEEDLAKKKSEEDKTIKYLSSDFNDRLIAIKDQKVAKIVMKDMTSSQFEKESLNFNVPPSDLHHEVKILVRQDSVSKLFELIHWQQMFKDQNSILNGLIIKFFDQMKNSAKKGDEFLSFKVQLIICKLFVDVAIKFARSQLDRIKRHMNSYISVVPAGNFPLTYKKEPLPENLSKFDFIAKNPSVEDLQLLLQILSDIQEQIWAQTKSVHTSPVIKQLMTSVSRPHSSFNRLGSFIQWDYQDISPIDISENSFYNKESNSLSQFCNQALDVSEISWQNVFDFGFLEETYGQNNRALKSLVSENVPLYKTLNYLPAQPIFISENISETLLSPNSSFIMFADTKGQVQISSSLLQLVPLSSLNFFSQDFHKKQLKYLEIHAKIDSRKETFDDYKLKVVRTSATLNIQKEVIKSETAEESNQQSQANNLMKVMKKKDTRQEMKNEKYKNEKKKKHQVVLNQQKLILQQQQEQLKQSELLKEKEGSKTWPKKNEKKLENYTILGYILLSKPEFIKAIDPLYVGCVYLNEVNKKYYVKVRKVIFNLAYLHGFLNLNPQTGLIQNKLNGKQMIESTEIHQLYQEVLNNHDVIVDLSQVFMINQDEQSIKKEYKYLILTDIAEVIQEIGDSSQIKILDFTHCSYSIDNQDTIHILLEELASNNCSLMQIKLSNTKIEQDEIPQLMQLNIKVEKSFSLKEKAFKMLQFDDKVLLIGESFYKTFSYANFDQEITFKFEDSYKYSSTDSFQIVNKTPEKKMFNRRNWLFFKGKIPDQDWQLEITSQEGTQKYYKLKKVEQEKVLKKRQSLDEFDIQNFAPNDILQIGNLLDCQYIGTLGQKSPNYYLSSSGIDSQSHLFSHHTWQKIQQSSTETSNLKLQIPKEYKKTNIREIELEFSFIKTNDTPHDVSGILNLQRKQTYREASKYLKRLPLIIENVVGAQISDQIQPCYLLNPDNQSFSSNYPQPEFIFKHQTGKLFQVNQFIIKSKETREWNGVPISTGLIFLSESLEDLQNTKQFQKFTEKEYKLWKAKRDNFANIPLQSSEPFIFFDMADENEIVISVPISKPCRFIKLVPTGFRKKPINFTSKPFNSNQSEIQFFGVNGNEVLSEQRGLNTDYKDYGKGIEVPLLATLTETNQGEVQEIQKVFISEIRTSKSQNANISIASLKQIKEVNTIGVAKVIVLLKEEQNNNFNEIQLKVFQDSNPDWKFSGVTMSLKAFTDTSAIFSEEILQQSKQKMRTYLLNLEKFPVIMLKLLGLVQSEDAKEDKKKAALQSILKLLRKIGNDQLHQDYIELFKKHTEIEMILNERFIEMSQSYQTQALKFLENIGSLIDSQAFISDFILSSIQKLQSKCWNKQSVSQFFELIQWCNSEMKVKIQSQIISIFFEQVCKVTLPKFQTNEYISLRSKLQIDAFPFDNIKAENSQSQSLSLNNSKTLDGYLHLLDSKFQMFKINTLYHFNVDFTSISYIDKLKLYFDHDPKGLYKIQVKVIAPDHQGNQKVILSKVFDENTYVQVCERAHVEDNANYFSYAIKHDPRLDDSQKNLQKKGVTQKGKKIFTGMVDLNFITLDLHGYVGRYLKLQIDLLDSYKTVHKSIPVTQIFIRPEFYGQLLEKEQKEEEQLAFPQFEVQDPDQESFLIKKIISNIEYKIYSIPQNQLSQMNRGFLFIQGSAQKKGKGITQEENQEIMKNELIKYRTQLSEMIQKADTSLEPSIKEMVGLISDIQSKGVEVQSENELNLTYLLTLSDILAGQILIALKQSKSLLQQNQKEKLDLQEMFFLIFNCFVVKDQLKSFQNIEKLSEVIFQQIEDKTKLIFSIMENYLFINDKEVNQKAIIQFILSCKDIQINQLLSNYLEFLGLDSKNSQGQLNDSLEAKNSIEIFQNQEDVPISLIDAKQVLVMLSFVDESKIDKIGQEINIDYLIRIIVEYIKSNTVKNLKSSKCQIILQFGLSIILKILEGKNISINSVLISNQKDFINFIQACIQVNCKQIIELLKKFVLAANKKDSNSILSITISYLMSWYNVKENIQNCHFYRSLEEEAQGKGANYFVMHLSIILKLYVKVLQTTNTKDVLSQTYQQIGEVMYSTFDLLNLNTSNYKDADADKDIIWDQIYYSISFLDQNMLQSNKVFEQLAQKFYQLPLIKQETLYPKFHVNSQRLMSQSQYKDPTVLILILSAFLQEGLKNNSSFNTTYCFCDGLIRIIQSGTKELLSTSIYCKFTNYSFSLLLNLFSSYLKDHINKGIYYGVSGSQMDTLMKLNLANEMSIILVQSKNSQEQNAMETYIKETQVDSNKLQQDEQILKNLIDWLFINYQKGKTLPSGEKIQSICINVEQIVCQQSLNDKIVLKNLPILMKTVLKVDQQLRNNMNSKTINHERAIQIQKTTNSLFLTIFKTWVNQDEIAKSFLLELNGFDFLLDRLFTKKDFLFKQKSTTSQEDSDEEEMVQLMNSIKLKMDKNFKPEVKKKHKKENKALPGSLPPITKKQTAIIHSVTQQMTEEKVEDAQAEKDLESQLQIEDFGRSMKLIWSSDKEKAISNSYSFTQWNKSKTGNKNRIFNYQINDVKMEYEYVLQFDLEKVVELTEVCVGMLFNWSTYDLDTQYEPLTFILEGGITQDKIDWKVLLTPILDRGYMYYSVIPYVCNFIESTVIDSQDFLNQSIQSISKKECRYLQLKLRKPLMSCLDTSMLVNSSKKIKSYGISYISVNGVQIEEKPVFQYLIDIQKDNSLEVLSKFFSGEFTEAFGLISQQPQMIEKIKNAYDKLSVLLDSKAQLVKPIFLSMCSKNQELSDWIMVKRLISLDEQQIKKEQIKFLGDIISSNKEKQLEKLTKLQEFLLSSISLIHLKKTYLSDEKQILLSRFINLYCNKLREFSSFLNHLQNDEKTLEVQEKDKEIEFTVDDLESVVALMSSCKAGKSRFFNSLTKFVLILLQPPKPFQNLTVKINDYVTSLLDLNSNQLQNLLFSSIIASTNEQALNTILDQGKIDWVLEELEKQVNLASVESFQLAQVIYNCTKQLSFRDKYCTTIIQRLYKLIKVDESKVKQEQKLLKKDVNESFIDIVVHIIQDLVVGHSQDEEDLSLILKKDIQAASEIADVEFINQIIVPILHSEENIPVSINLFDKQQPEKRIVPIFTSQEVETKGSQFFLNTDILNSKQKQVFMKSMKDISSDKVENFTKMVEQQKWELVFSSKSLVIDSSKFRQFIQATQNKSNLIILAQCNINSQKAVLGGYCQKPFPALGDSWAHEFDYQIPYGEGNFVFYYTPEKELHFTMIHNKPFGYIYTDYEEGGALSVSGDFFLVSWSHEFQNSCGNIYDMKCLEEPSILTFYSNVEISSFEIWWPNNLEKSTIQDGKIKNELKKSQFFNSYSPFNFFRENLVFEVSKNMQLDKLAEEIMGKHQVFIDYSSQNKEEISGKKQIYELLSENKTKLSGELISSDPVFDLVVMQNLSNTAGGGGADETLKKNELTQADEKKKGETQEEQSTINDTTKPLMKKFEEKGGVLDLIKAAKTAVALFKNEKIKFMWSLWLNEIESFSQLPTFFQTFSKNREKETIVYKLLEGEYDKQMSMQKDNSTELQRLINKQEELHIEMVKYSYKIVNEVFEKYEGAELRDQCLKNGTFERFIERIGQLSSENKRSKKILTSKEIQTTNEGAKTDGKNMKKKEDPYQKRKGVGYTTGVGTTWNVSEYLKSKEAKSAQAANIVNILKHVIKSKDWEVPPEIKELILESALLPTLEAAFRSGSLLEMAKEFDLNMAYLGFVQEIASHSTLIDLVMDISSEYEPVQKESILFLLNKLSDLSSIFLQCLTSSSLEKDQKNLATNLEERPRLLAEKILETKKLVEERVQEQVSLQQQTSLQEILAMPLSDAYFKLLSPLRFEYMSMKDSSGIYSHAYSMEISKNVNPPVSKLVRLAQEIADLSNSLPCDYTNGVFCRVDKEKVDLMKCLVMGASGTPYAHGAFIYDLYFDNAYPNVPPKCQLVTTGGGTVRFNPNLYHNGKVCLSLLGTWRGSATENWDPKLSTILQVLLSIQAIIMSNEVYFNEPGYEHESGTPEGEKKNEGYANIVRYCNVKFAIIEAIKNPPPGFEKIIKRNFYLKKNVILQEVAEWVEKSKTTEATYTGLVYDHNYQWAPQISPEGKYCEMMTALYQELKKTLDSIPSPFEDESTGKKLEINTIEPSSQQEKKDDQVKGDVKFDHIDVSYDESKTQNLQINIEDEKVKDRWSRYIGAMGIESVAKQAASRVMIIGLGPLGVEIAKNIILAGCKELILSDNLWPVYLDLGGQFFLSDQDIEAYEKSRADCCKEKLQQLNMYVKVTVLPKETDNEQYIFNQEQLKVVVYADDIVQQTQQKVYALNKVCRDKGIAFIQCCQNGLFSKIFTDFGDKHLVIDKDGEELQEVMIKDISCEQEGVVTLLEGIKHKFEDGDQVEFKEVVGMKTINQGEDSINGKVFTVKQINPSQFKIGDTTIFEKYEGNGIAKQLKVQKTISFKSLKEIDESDETPPFDNNLMIADFEKMENFKFAHYCYQGFQNLLLTFMEDTSNQDEMFMAIEDMMDNMEGSIKLFTDSVTYKFVTEEERKDEAYMKRLQKFILIFWSTIQSYISPISAMIGGIVAQEIIKAITCKFVPISQLFYFDAIELFPDLDFDKQEEIIKTLIDQRLQFDQLYSEKIQQSNRYYSFYTCFGKEMVKKIQEMKIFVVGAGAIGCEIMKNLAMLGVGSQGDGVIYLTDPDVIEVSNLNRQFLFREKHLRQAKSITAAASICQMNPMMKGHISARLDKIHEGTANIYDENFYKNCDIVLNALDNVNARLYLDEKCVRNRVPMIDSGTLGPKGHVQLVIPFKTESYASQNDPEDNLQIPHCTLKMFPEEALHCMEWAKDVFGRKFSLASQSFNKYIIEEQGKEPNLHDSQEIAQIKKLFKIVEKKPKTFEDCILLARLMFQKHSVNDIKQLLHVYPLDKLTKEDRPFWSLPKRPPHPIDYDPEDLLHQSFIAACSCLYAQIYNLEIPFKDPRNQESKQEMAKKAQGFQMKEFVPNDKKAQSIESEVEKNQSKDQAEDQIQQEDKEMLNLSLDVEFIKKKFQQIIQPLKVKETVQMKVEEFEKDDDKNFHIDFIHSLANIRVRNYALEEMDWLTVKIKAGRIIPALATTTATIAAIQTIEMLKIIKKCEIKDMRNSFINLAVPSMMFSEPGAPVTTKLTKDLNVTLWDIWEYKDAEKNCTLLEIVEFFKGKFGLTCRDIFYGSIPLFISIIQGKTQQDREKNLNQQLLTLTGSDKNVSYIDLTLTFVDESAEDKDLIVKGVPPIRVIFK